MNRWRDLLEFAMTLLRVVFVKADTPNARALQMFVRCGLGVVLALVAIVVALKWLEFWLLGGLCIGIGPRNGIQPGATEFSRLPSLSLPAPFSQP